MRLVRRLTAVLQRGGKRRGAAGGAELPTVHNSYYNRIRAAANATRPHRRSVATKAPMTTTLMSRATATIRTVGPTDEYVASRASAVAANITCAVMVNVSSTATLAAAVAVETDRRTSSRTPATSPPTRPTGSNPPPYSRTIAPQIRYKRLCLSLRVRRHCHATAKQASETRCRGTSHSSPHRAISNSLTMSDSPLRTTNVIAAMSPAAPTAQSTARRRGLRAAVTCAAGADASTSEKGTRASGLERSHRTVEISAGRCAGVAQANRN